MRLISGARRRQICASAVLALLACPAAGFAQTHDWTVDLRKAAERLASSLEASGVTMRVGVIPITAPDAALVPVATDTTASFLRALDAEPNWPPRAVQVIGGQFASANNPAVNTEARAPIDVAEAVRAGKRAATAYVIVGHIIASSKPSPERVELQLIDVNEARAVKTATARFQQNDPASPTDQSFWTSKQFALIVGAAATVLAGSRAVRANDQLNLKKAELLAVPAGDNATFARVRGEADAIAKTRDWWWGVTAGIAGVTTSYMVLTRSSPDLAARPIHDPVPITTRRGWAIGVNPLLRRVSFTHSF